MVLVRNKRRALSTVVTTTIMLTAVAVIGAGVVAWANTNSRTFETILVSSSADKLNKINEMPKIENVVLSTAPVNINKMNITVSNVGTIGFNVTNIKVSSSGNCATYPTYSTAYNDPTCPNSGITSCAPSTFDSSCKSITPKSSRWYLVIYPPGGTGVLTDISVTTNRGTTVTTQAIK